MSTSIRFCFEAGVSPFFSFLFFSWYRNVFFLFSVLFSSWRCPVFAFSWRVLFYFILFRGEDSAGEALDALTMAAERTVSAVRFSRLFQTEGERATQEEKYKCM